MKRLIVGLACLFPATALATPLPFAGRYCGEDMTISSRGIEWDDAGCVANSIGSAPKFPLTCYVAEESEPINASVTLTEDLSAGTLTVTDESGTVVLHKCED